MLGRTPLCAVLNALTSPGMPRHSDQIPMNDFFFNRGAIIWDNFSLLCLFCLARKRVLSYLSISLGRGKGIPNMPMYFIAEITFKQRRRMDLK